MELQKRVAERSGWEGGLLGAGLGAISVVTALKAANREVTPTMVLTGAVVGIALGAADKKLLQGDSGGGS
ncbi:MAG: hypothetical protein ACK4FG_04710 [Brevundimonas sp.]